MKILPATITLIAIASRVTLGSGQELYATPDAAVSAFLEAVASDTDSRMAAVLGTPMVQAMRDDIPGRDWWGGLASVRPTSSRVRLQVRNSSRLVLYVGLAQPFALELFHTESGWRFDNDAAIRELLQRRVYRNQQAVTEMCQRYVRAQWDSSTQRQGFAPRISSSLGKQDGLYWSDPEAAEESPLGPRFASAAFGEQKSHQRPQPYFGYYFKVLLRQGSAAPGGALEYLESGRAVYGFALLAWPAEYGRSGVVSYLVNHLGSIYQKDLGPDTHYSALSTVEFNPDTSWKKLGHETDVDDE